MNNTIEKRAVTATSLVDAYSYSSNDMSGSKLDNDKTDGKATNAASRRISFFKLDPLKTSTSGEGVRQRQLPDRQREGVPGGNKRERGERK
jgi:hypothetical protein